MCKGSLTSHYKRLDINTNSYIEENTQVPQIVHKLPKVLDFVRLQNRRLTQTSGCEASTGS